MISNLMFRFWILSIHFVIHNFAQQPLPSKINYSSNISTSITNEMYGNRCFVHNLVKKKDRIHTFKVYSNIMLKHVKILANVQSLQCFILEMREINKVNRVNCTKLVRVPSVTIYMNISSEDKYLHTLTIRTQI